MATIHTYTCNVCPGCSCGRTVGVIGDRKPIVRQVCPEFAHMDGFTNWVKVEEQKTLAGE